jgi:hypothetical protein
MLGLSPGKIDWKAYDNKKIIGAKDGIETPYMRIEISANTIHGHPITPEEFITYTKPKKSK